MTNKEKEVLKCGVKLEHFFSFDRCNKELIDLATYIVNTKDFVCIDFILNFYTDYLKEVDFYSFSDFYSKYRLPIFTIKLYKLYSKYLAKFNLFSVFDLDEFKRAGIFFRLKCDSLINGATITRNEVFNEFCNFLSCLYKNNEYKLLRIYYIFNESTWSKFLTYLRSSYGRIEAFFKKNLKFDPDYASFRFKLKCITKYRKFLLEKGNIILYDNIGKDLSSIGCENVYNNLIDNFD